MSFTCPNGHRSETADYCDQCGARIDGASVKAGPAAAPAAPAAPPAVEAPAASPSGNTNAAVSGEESCPICQTPRVGEDRFCEVCGYDYSSPAAGTGSGQPILAAAVGTTSTPAWEAVAVADREYFERVAPEGVTFPLHCPPRTFLLAGAEIRIGRRSNSRGVQPEIDLSGAPEDTAISHLHCLLIEQPDRSYSLVDPGSTNGTTLNGDATPLTANIAVALADGDRIHLGAWTTITIRARPPVETVTPAP